MAVQYSNDFGWSGPGSQGLISDFHAALEVEGLSTKVTSQARRDGVASKGSTVAKYLFVPRSRDSDASRYVTRLSVSPKPPPPPWQLPHSELAEEERKRSEEQVQMDINVGERFLPRGWIRKNLVFHIASASSAGDAL